MSPIRKRYSFWINEAEAQGLKAIKEAEGTTESEQIRQAIRDWLKRKGIRRSETKRPSAKARQADGGLRLAPSNRKERDRA
jgi:hypothetical protein